MRCRVCGCSFPDGQSSCPDCGATVDNNVSSNIVPSTLGIPTGMGADNFSSFSSNMPSNNMGNMNSMGNMNIPNGMAANNRDSFTNSSNFNGFNNGTNNVINSNINNNNANNFNNNYNEFPGNVNFNNSGNMNNGMNNNMLPVNEFENQANIMNNLKDDDKEKKKSPFGDFTTKIPWIPLGIGLLVFMIIGMIFLPQYEKNNLTVYQTDRFVLKYNKHWTLDDSNSNKNMKLVYKDKKTEFALNTVVTYKSINYEVNSEETRKKLYQTLYNAWSKIDYGTLNGGTDTFLDLDNGAMYARIDYEQKNQSGIGSFYIVLSKQYDIIITYSLLTTKDLKQKVDPEVYDMINLMSFKAVAVTSSLNDAVDFKVEDSAKYSIDGYINYNVPTNWKYDVIRSNNNSNVFNSADNATMLSVKAATAYGDNGAIVGINYEKIKNSFANIYGAIKEEDSVVINDKVWYKLIGVNYINNGVSYHTETYFTLSDSNLHYYWLEVYIPNYYSDEEYAHVENDVKYVLNSCELINAKN